MAEIVLEDVLFVALIATVVVLVVFALVEFTPLGLRLRQARNRRLIEETAERTCPVHGPHAASDMVLLPSGERICPECFKEVVHD
jgi:hypothetical protein